MSRNQIHQRRTSTSREQPPTIDTTFAIIVPPSDNELVDHLKRPAIFGTLAQKREYIVNSVLPLRPRILQLIRSVAPFLEDVFVSNLPEDAKDIPKKGTAIEMAWRWLRLQQVLQSLKGVCVGGEMRLTRADTEFIGGGEE